MQVYDMESETFIHAHVFSNEPNDGISVFMQGRKYLCVVYPYYFENGKPVERVNGNEHDTREIFYCVEA